MYRASVFFLLAIAIFSSGHFSGGSLSASMGCIGKNCNVVVSSSLFSTIMAILLLLFMVLFPRKKYQLIKTSVVGGWQRFFSFMIDIMVLLFIAIPLTALPVLIKESGYTNNFVWSFSRNYTQPTDGFLIGFMTIFVLLGIWYYFYKHLKTDAQTLGQYVLGYGILPDDKNTTDTHLGIRVIYTAAGFCMWPLSWFTDSEDKQLWWNKITQTKARQVL